MKQNIITREEAQKLYEDITKCLQMEEFDEEEWDKMEKTAQEAAKAIRNVLAANNLTHIAIPRCLGYKLNRYPHLTVIDNQDGFSKREIKNYYDNEHVLFPGRFKYGEILLAVLDALDYYRENNIPKYDWGGENDITRRLRQDKEIISDIIIPEHTEDILGKECRVMTCAKFFSANGLRLHTIINFRDDTPEDYKSDYFFMNDDDDRTQCFDMMMELESGVHAIADLISHYGIHKASAAEMLTTLAEAMKKDAEVNGFRSCKDFVPLFNELGVIYSMRSRSQFVISDPTCYCSNGGDGWYDEDSELDDDDDLYDDEGSEIDNIEYDEEGFEDPV